MVIASERQQWLSTASRCGSTTWRKHLVVFKLILSLVLFPNIAAAIPSRDSCGGSCCSHNNKNNGAFCNSLLRQQRVKYCYNWLLQQQKLHRLQGDRNLCLPQSSSSRRLRRLCPYTTATPVCPSFGLFRRNGMMASADNDDDFDAVDQQSQHSHSTTKMSDENVNVNEDDDPFHSQFPTNALYTTTMIRKSGYNHNNNNNKITRRSLLIVLLGTTATATTTQMLLPSVASSQVLADGNPDLQTATTTTSATSTAAGETVTATTTTAGGTRPTLVQSWLQRGGPPPPPKPPLESGSSGVSVGGPVTSSTASSSISSSSPSSTTSALSLLLIRPRLPNTTTTTITTMAKNPAAGMLTSSVLQDLNRERTLLQLLPIRNDRQAVFRALQGRLEGISFALTRGNSMSSSSSSEGGGGGEENANTNALSARKPAAASSAAASMAATMMIPSATWDRLRMSMNETISYLDRQRDQLSPVFNQDDSTTLAINKAEQGELRIETLRSLLVDLRDLCATAAAAAATTTSSSSSSSSDDDDGAGQEGIDSNNDTRPSRRPMGSKIVATVQRQQRLALIALAEVGELLVATFPYDVPSEGKFSYLPRLLGRARVTFSIRRPQLFQQQQRRSKNQNNNNILQNLLDLAKIAADDDTNNDSNRTRKSSSTNNNNNNNRDFLGNITILADGFLAPITAGNFVDLSVRNFYTGLPVRSVRKRFGNVERPPTWSSSSTVAETLGVAVDDVSILGRFNEGFYDPLTAKLRRLPLEIIRIENTAVINNKRPCLSYSLPTSAAVSAAAALATATTAPGGDGIAGAATSVLDTNSFAARSTKPLLSFSDIPGLVAFNHPNQYPNSGSSEFFCLPTNSLPAERRKLLDGQYAPLGYIVQGLDIWEALQPNDYISNTVVDEWGLLNLVKIRESSRLSDIVSSSPSSSSSSSQPQKSSSIGTSSTEKEEEEEDTPPAAAAEDEESQ